MDLVQVTAHRPHEQLLLHRTNSTILVGRDFPARPHLSDAPPTTQLHFVGITQSEHPVNE